MHTHRFGTKIKLPSTIAIKHQMRKLMFEDLVKEAAAALQGAAAQASPTAPARYSVLSPAGNAA
jgi:hypothetical protein